MAWSKPTYPKAPATTQSTTAAEYKPTVPTNIGSAGAALGVGAGVIKPIANNPPVSGASIGIGGGTSQGSAYTQPAPAPSGGGGSMFGAGTGMTANDWAALIAAQQAAPAPVDRSAEGSIGGAATAGGLDVYGRSGPGDPFANMGTGTGFEQLPPGEGSSIYTDPGFLSLIAGMEAELAGNESGMRRQQDEARRRFTTDLPMFERNWDQNRGRLKNAFEARGLLKSGGTEDAVSRSYQSQGEERARGEANVADTIANLEGQIANARAAFNRNKGQAAIQYAGQQPVT